MGDAAEARSFFLDLPGIEKFDGVADPDNYRTAPSDWFVVVSDVRGSTNAIEAGKYKEVNVLGAASIAAVLKELDSRSIPYVFGGDGATLLVPPAVLERVKAVLVGLAEVSRDFFGLDLRVGVVPVEELEERGSPVKVGRYLVSEDVDLAMFWGAGIGLAEDLVKDSETEAHYAVGPGDVTVDLEPDFTALQCRWKPIATRRGEMSSILVMAQGPPEERAEAYRDFLRYFEEVVEADASHPVAPTNMEMGADRETVRPQAMLHTKKSSGLALAAKVAELVGLTKFGSYLLTNGKKAAGFDGATYMDQLVANTDFRKFDDVLRMVVDLRSEEVEALREYLEEQRRNGELVYGIHGSDAALMTCVVFDYDRDHIHFIDGADGGYALAAKEMKAQMKNQS